ncbi:MAG: glutamate synthase subunit beta [Candidatus Omnitrophica bacterium]|nr:glutamate synthase subunit beta [Candidatus Omnitrophota bacterium]
MSDPKGFLKTKRQSSKYRPVYERVADYREVNIAREDEETNLQSSRCMNCGTPFCHWACPVGNYIPEWNNLVFERNWQKAYVILEAANNFPEITGRLCPALCESSCVLGINDDPVTIRENELGIIEYAFKKGLVRPKKPAMRTGKKIAVIGSGPAGLAASSQLNKAGHKVVVFEKGDKIGGLLRYGIPDFKLEKHIIDRRIDLMKKEGIEFIVKFNAGVDISAEKILKEFDAVCLAIGSGVPRDLKIDGRGASGVHFAMDYLIQSNKRVSGEINPNTKLIDAKGKKVVVIGGGDTGSDCVGVANRQGAASVTQIELMSKPAEYRTEDYPWPMYPAILKTSSSHEEGASRLWQVSTKRFIAENGRVNRIECVKVEFEQVAKNVPAIIKEIPSSNFEIEADLVILAMGFIHPEHRGLLEALSTEYDGRGNVKTNEHFMTSVKKVFAAGDAHRGQSLVIWAMSEARRAAHNIDCFLMGKSDLPEF